MFRFIFFILSLYIIFKVVRFLLQSSSFRNRTTAKEGDVRVNYEGPAKKTKYGNHGEYIDYEEVKQK